MSSSTAAAIAGLSAAGCCLCASSGKPSGGGGEGGGGGREEHGGGAPDGDVLGDALSLTRRWAAKKTAGPTAQPKYGPVAELGSAFDLVPAREPDRWAEAALPVILTCEHAGSALPRGYDWGPDDRLRGTHWAVDIGIRQVCLDVQQALGCPAVLTRYSRLFCDCNRPPPAAKHAAASGAGNQGQGGASAAYLTSPFCQEAEGQPIVLNTSLSDAEVEKRLAGAWRPYHNALVGLVEASPRRSFLLSLHSYTRVFEQQPPRSVEVGILCWPERDLLPGKPASRLLALLEAAGVDVRINVRARLSLASGLFSSKSASDNRADRSPTPSCSATARSTRRTRRSWRATGVRTSPWSCDRTRSTTRSGAPRSSAASSSASGAPRDS